MSTSEEDESECGELRSVPCEGDPITLLAVNNDAAAWCTVSRAVVVWSRHAQEPQELLRLSFAPVTMTLTDGGLLVLTSATSLFAYTLRTTTDGELHMGDPLVLRDDNRTVLSAQATSVAVAQDESAGAIATPSHLALLALPHNGAASAGTRSAPDRAAIACRSWFGGPSNGCALVCFASPSRLLVCSEEAHLVSVRVDSDAMTASRERDGHVLVKGQTRVTCLSPSFAHDNLLLVGFTSGDVQLLQLDTLAPTQTLQTRLLLRQLAADPASLARPVFDSARPWRTAGPDAARRSSASDTPCGQSAVVSVSVGAARLTVLTTDGVLYLDKASLELCEDTSFLLESEERLSASTSLAASARNGCWCAWDPLRGVTTLHYFVAAPGIGAAGGGRLRWGAVASTDRGDDGRDDVIHARTPLPAAWLSDAASTPPGRSSSVSTSKSAAPRGRGGGRDGPLTFGHRVQSSGYSQAVPWSEQQKLKKKALAKREQLKQAQQFGGASTSAAPSAQRYGAVQNYADHRFQSLTRTNALLDSRAALHEGSVLAATFAGSGSSLLTGGSEGSAYQLAFPVSKKDVAGCGLRGHTGAVLSVDTSLSLKNPLAVTGSADGTVALWKPGSNRHEAAVARCTPGASPTGAKTEVRAARFFYLDKFICYTYGQRCCLARYNLETREAKDGLTHVTSPAQIAAPVFSFDVPEAQSITAMACINHFASPLLILAGSNKSLCVLDVAAQAPLRLLADAHTRAIHHVAMCSSSRFASGPLCGSLAEHTLLTAGLDGVVNMWDLRQPQRVGQFALHKNTALQSLGLALSPTGQQFAMGSEDRHVYVYDARAPMTALDVLAVRHVPSAIAWHPTDPVLAVGDTSGRLTLFAQS